MSTIAVALSRSNEGEHLAFVDRMLAHFAAYSPDGTHAVRSGDCALGVGHLVTAARHRRAAAWFEDGDLSLVVDGHLDRVSNARLGLVCDPDASDAEIVQAAFRRWGDSFVTRLRGDFALAIWEKKRSRLLVVRDSFGTRPLYYWIGDGRVLVASDPEQILATGAVPAKPDHDMVMDYLLWEIRHPDRTFIEGVSALPPGHTLVVDEKGSRVSSYRSPALELLRFQDKAECWLEYRRRFTNAVRHSLESRYPVVADLSGGLDSSSIVCAGDRLVSADSGLCPSLTAVAGLFPGLDCDEEPFVRAVARHVAIPTECWDGTRGAVNEFEDVSLALPGSRFAMYGGTEGNVEIARRRDARVLLSGVGGDNVGVPDGAARDAISEGRFRDAWRILSQEPGVRRPDALRALWGTAKSFAPQFVRDLRARTRTPGRRPDWLSPWARDFRRGRPSGETPGELTSEIHRRSWRSLVTSGRQALVMGYIQHHAIRSGIEVRYPFLNVDLAAVVYSTPPRFWPPQWPGERLHREILSDTLPAEVVRRRSKANFASALAQRVNRQLPAIREILHIGSWASARYIDRTKAQNLLVNFERTPEPRPFPVAYALWSVVTIEAWLRAVSRYPTRQE